MGLNEGGGNRTYLKISDGRISKRVPEGTKGAIECFNKDKTKTWWEARYPSVTGRVADIKKRTTEWGVDLCLTIDDGRELFELQMPWSSGYSSGFFCCMPNIDFTGPVTFTPWMKIVDDKKKTALYITNGEAAIGKDNVEWYWTKNTPYDCPPMKKVMFKGKESWDDTERQEFFEKFIEEIVMPQLKAAPEGENNDFVTSDHEKPQYQAAPQTMARPAAESHELDDDSGLPF